MLREEKITPEQCRDILGSDGEKLTDNQIIDLRDAMYTLAENVLDSLFINLTVDTDHE